MPKGLENKLLLKRKLLSTRDMIKGVLESPLANDLSIKEKKIYSSWLTNTEELINICIERNKF